MSTLALMGGTKTVRAKMASPKWPRFSKATLDKVRKILSEGRGITLGNSEIVADAERKFARFHGTRYALAVSSGTASLHCAVAGCDIGPGDHVITSPYSWGATTGCILHQGAVPVFADVDPEWGLLDPRSVESKITSKTRGIVVVHLYGQPAPMDELVRIARRHRLALIEDGSQAHGARYRGRYVGAWGDAAGFSCMGGKLCATTELGVMITNKRDIYERGMLTSQHKSRIMRASTVHGGGVSPKFEPYIDSLDFSLRATDVDCVLLADQIDHLTYHNRNRSWNRDRLARGIEDLGFIRACRYPRHAKPTYHLMNLRFDPAAARGVTRATMIKALQAEGVGIFQYVNLISEFERMKWWNYKGPACAWMDQLRRAKIRYRADDTPTAVRVMRETGVQLSMNAHTERDPKYIDQVIAAFHKLADNLDALRAWQRHNPAR